jgi:hypothetical protein
LVLIMEIYESINSFNIDSLNLLLTSLWDTSRIVSRGKQKKPTRQKRKGHENHHQALCNVS